MAKLYSILLITQFSLAVPVFILLMFIRAPYGKFTKSGWGPSLNARPGWFLMELPAVILPPIFYLLSGRVADFPGILFILVWELHYIQRTFVYPALLNRGSHTMPLLIILFSMLFNLINGYINGFGVFIMEPVFPASNLRIAAGLVIFAAGFVINMHSDRILRNLREPGETGYKMPKGGLFSFICSPHYFGELLEWTGWTVMTAAPAAAAFLVFTAANLVPRAAANLKWYRKTLPDFPAKIKAVIPGVF